MSTNKILVTGAAGFIGYHLCKSLIKDGYEVLGVDNINDYYDVNLKYARLKELGIKKEKIINSKSIIQNSESIIRSQACPPKLKCRWVTDHRSQFTVYRLQFTEM